MGRAAKKACGSHQCCYMPHVFPLASSATPNLKSTADEGPFDPPAVMSSLAQSNLFKPTYLACLHASHKVFKGSCWCCWCVVAEVVFWLWLWLWLWLLFWLFSGCGCGCGLGGVVLVLLLLLAFFK